MRSQSRTTKCEKGDVIFLPYTELDHGRVKISRGIYLVEEARMGGGGTAMFNDYYPDGWQVTARKFNGGDYNPNGEVITFYQSGAFNTRIDTPIQVWGKMKQKWVMV